MEIFSLSTSRKKYPHNSNSLISHEKTTLYGFIFQCGTVGNEGISVFISRQEIAVDEVFIGRGTQRRMNLENCPILLPEIKLEKMDVLQDGCSGH